MTDGQILRKPNDRLTRICDAMSHTFHDHDEHEEGDKVCVFIEDGRFGGIVVSGYDDEYVAMIALLIHIRALFRALGQDVLLVPLEEGGPSHA